MPVTVTRGEGESFELPTDHQVEIVIAGGECSVTASTGSSFGPGSCSIDLVWDGDEEQPTTRLNYFDTRGTSGSWGPCSQFDWNDGVSKVCSYARGTMHVRPGPSSTFNLVINIDVDDYVLGISEMPYTWHPEALAAQAIAARSYAIRRALSRPPPDERSCWCDIVDTPADQNYVGWGHGTQNWIDAVRATEDMVLTHPSEVHQGVPLPTSRRRIAASCGSGMSILSVSMPRGAAPSRSAGACWAARVRFRR